jgi:hypothetical protein
MSSITVPNERRATLTSCGVCRALPGQLCEPICEAVADHTGVEPEWPRPWINPDSCEGNLILQLFAHLKHLEGDLDDDECGEWNGGDVVDFLCEWLPSMGIGINDSYDAVLDRLRGGLRLHTVFGLRDNHAPETTLISAVAVGEITGVHTQPLGRWERVTTCVFATDAEHAEQLASAMFAQERASDPEPIHTGLPVFAEAVRAASQQPPADDRHATPHLTTGYMPAFTAQSEAQTVSGL